MTSALCNYSWAVAAEKKIISNELFEMTRFTDRSLPKPTYLQLWNLTHSGLPLGLVGLVTQLPYRWEDHDDCFLYYKKLLNAIDGRG